MEIDQPKVSLRYNADRGKIAIAMLCVFGVADLIMLSMQLWERSIYQNEIDPAVLDDYISKQVIVTILWYLVYIPTIVAFVMWFRRAYFNLHSLGIPLKHTEGWAAGAWFIPILFLFWPFRIMREIYEFTYKLGHGKAAPMTWILGIWWAFWVIRYLAEGISGQLIGYSESVSELAIVNTFSLISTYSGLIALPLIIFIIIRVMKFEKVMRKNHHEMDITEHLIAD